MGRIIRARAPLRISFCGGGTDVAPYPQHHGGVALNATINRFAYCTLSLNDSQEIMVRSLDYGQVTRFALRETPIFDGNLDLLKAVFRRINSPALTGMSVAVNTDAPPGSGLGTSSAVVVAVIKAITQYLGLDLSPHEVANLAYVVERQDLGILGGLQDQYASAYGGFNFMEFDANGVAVYPLRIRPSVLFELESCLLLCFTGGTRLSAGIIQKQVANYENHSQPTVDGLHALKAITFELRRALLAGDIRAFGALLNDAWENKKLLTPDISSPDIDRIYAIARKRGALGGKLLGAGGGGYLLLCVEPIQRMEVAAALDAEGLTVSPFVNFVEQGAVGWENRLNVPTIPKELEG